MRRLFVIIGFITALLAVVLAVTPLSNLAVAPALIALVCGLIILYYSKKQEKSRKVIQYIFLLTIIALTITIYKVAFQTVEVGDVQQLEETEKTSEEEAIEELEDLNLLEETENSSEEEVIEEREDLNLDDIDTE